MDWTTGITATWITSLGRFLATATRPAASQPASFLDLAGKKTAVACPVGARPSRATTRCRAPFARPRARQRRPASARRFHPCRSGAGSARAVIEGWGNGPDHPPDYLLAHHYARQKGCHRYVSSFPIIAAHIHVYHMLGGVRITSPAVETG